MPGSFNPLAGPVTRHLFPSFFNCTPAETDVGTRLAGPARCGDLFVRARRAGCHRSGRATAAVRWPRCASLLRYARFARRILCPAGFLVALVFSRSKNASSNSSLLQAGAHVRSGGLQAASPLGRAFRPGSLTAPPPVPQTARRERAAALQPEPLRTVFVYL